MEFLIRVKDKVSDDIYGDVQLTKRGYVIAVVPDDHDWARQELINPEWRIIQVPMISRAEAESMLAVEPGLDVNRMRQRRAFKIDLDHMSISQSMRNFIDDDSRLIKRFIVPLGHFRSLRTRIQSIKDIDYLP